MHVNCKASVKFYIVSKLLFSAQENNLYTYLGNLTLRAFGVLFLLLKPEICEFAFAVLCFFIIFLYLIDHFF